MVLKENQNESHHVGGVLKRTSAHVLASKLVVATGFFIFGSRIKELLGRVLPVEMRGAPASVFSRHANLLTRQRGIEGQPGEGPSPNARKSFSEDCAGTRSDQVKYLTTYQRKLCLSPSICLRVVVLFVGVKGNR